MVKPVIGISVDCQQDPDDARSGGKLSLNWNYAQAISEAGGVPILIPPMADMAMVAQMIDGWLIPGGDDIDAKHFGEENHAESKLIDPARYEGESRLFDSANPDMPTLGICYGCQFVSVQRGGNLIQHLPEVVGHTNHTGGTLQQYRIEGSSKVSEIVGEPEIEGKSYHHQAIDRPGEGFQVVARSEDGTIEAIEAQDHPWMVGVQWHPERTLADPKTRRIFESFVDAARKYRLAKSKVEARR
ncbi:MAG: gamma-glutamyl-gamma-aminobutyrate hydrolase family protein [Chlorobia bacterium]|nr:gamma-glutamyl-gamma-aminobutyrate hydrolase family protein [Fimbriimonadaceae bacterium]